MRELRVGFRDRAPLSAVAVAQTNAVGIRAQGLELVTRQDRSSEPVTFPRDRFAVPRRRAISPRSQPTFGASGLCDSLPRKRGALN